MHAGLLPIERSFFPFIDETDSQDAEKHHHRPETDQTDFGERHRPREQERNFKVKDNKENGDKVKPHIELAACVVEWLETAFIGRELLRIWLQLGHQKRQHHHQERQHAGDAEKDEQ